MGLDRKLMQSPHQANVDPAHPNVGKNMYGFPR